MSNVTTIVTEMTEAALVAQALQLICNEIGCTFQQNAMHHAYNDWENQQADFVVAKDDIGTLADISIKQGTDGRFNFLWDEDDHNKENARAITQGMAAAYATVEGAQKVAEAYPTTVSTAESPNGIAKNFDATGQNMVGYAVCLEIEIEEDELAMQHT